MGVSGLELGLGATEIGRVLNLGLGVRLQQDLEFRLMARGARK